MAKKLKTTSDKRQEERAARLVRLGYSIRSAREGRMLSQQAFCEELEPYLGVPIVQTTVSRWEAGQVSLDVEQLFAIERALRLEPGTLLIRAGYVPSEPQPRDVETMLRTDPNISDTFRGIAVESYRQLRKASRSLGS